MFKDMSISGTLQDDIRCHTVNASLFLSGVDLPVKVLTTGYWLTTPGVKVNLPTVAVQAFEAYKRRTINLLKTMVRQRLVCPECRLRVFSNSVKCGGCNCSFHAGAEKCARIDTANWSESWCCPDCSSKKMPINKDIRKF
ncbi:uncharacterized protein LOC136027035 isoform X2 [Artemia franciscana]|uniref:uncharacterized protein LOC136027035 isoform X2 n=1 Tax=Artemia franciscana TaxID=6661 RepID=UPI0032DA9CAF